MALLSGAALAERMKAIKLLTVDTDGVLTDGGIYITDAGEELRKFNVKDGLGMKRVQAAGASVALVTASATAAIAHRARILGLDHVFLEATDKLAVIAGLCAASGLALDEVGHIGDDLNDLPVLTAVGCPMTVADAVDEVRAAAVYIAAKAGGSGAVREICDLIVKAKSG
jgi:3-deoxy-D-manno-octulosonate 8-phosphate phosphatase (KDO 8-P phosphatase)